MEGWFSLLAKGPPLIPTTLFNYAVHAYAVTCLLRDGRHVGFTVIFIASPSFFHLVKPNPESNFVITDRGVPVVLWIWRERAGHTIAENFLDFVWNPPSSKAFMMVGTGWGFPVFSKKQAVASMTESPANSRWFPLAWLSETSCSAAGWKSAKSPIRVMMRLHSRSWCANFAAKSFKTPL